MREGWTDFELGAICRPRQWPTIARNQMLESGYPVYGANGQIGFFSSYNHEKPTVAVTCRGASCGQVHLTPAYCYITGNAMALDDLAEGEVLPQFLAEVLRYRRFDEFVTGSAQPQIIGAAIGRVRIELPPLPEQQKIAEILDTLADAIRKTEQLIAKLEQVKQGLLHDLLTRGIDDNGELRDPNRHPEQFKESVLGRIPKEWKLASAETFCDSVADGTHDTPKPASQGRPLITSKNLKGGRIDWTDTYMISESAYRSVRARSWVEPGDILFGMIGTIGNPVVLQEREHQIAPKNVGIFRFRGDSVRARYFCAYLESSVIDQQLCEVMAGSTQKFVGLATLRSLVVVYPERLEMETLVQTIDGIENRVAFESAALRKHRLLKQGLMEDLLSGQTRVTPLLGAKP